MNFMMISLQDAAAAAALVCGAALAIQATRRDRLKLVLESCGGALLVAGLVLLGTALPFAG